jgi:hypothetical protein
MPMSPFQRLLGDEFAVLPEPVQRFHGFPAGAAIATEGRADIVMGSGLLPRLACFVSGLPAAGRDVPVTVVFEVDESGDEFWRRRFAGRRYQSGFAAGTGRRTGLLVERFFPYVFFHRLTATAEGLRWDLVGWRLLWLPLPGWLMPPTVCFESGDGDRFRFDIDVKFPLIGRLVHYRGWLAQKNA